MFELIFIVGLTIWGYRRIKKYLTGMKAASSNTVYGDTVTIQEYEEVDDKVDTESDEVEADDNTEELKELKKTIKKSIKYQLKY